MRRLLILIDLQDGWRHRTASEKAMLRAVDCATSFPGDVIHCCFKNDRQSAFWQQLHWRRFFESKDTTQIPEITTQKLPVYWRSTYSCINEETEPIVTKYDHVYLAGVFTDVSIAATAMSLFDKGIPVSVVRDCVATLHGDDVQRAALKSLGFILGDQYVINAAQIPRN